MNDGPGPWAIFAIYKSNFAAMCAGNLLREGEPDAAALGLGCIERNKEIFDVGNPQTAVFDAHDEIRFSNAPSDAYGLGAVGQRCVHRILEQVDEHLFKLIRIGIQQDRRTWIKSNRHALLKESNPFQQRSGLNLLEMRRRQLRKNPVGLNEAMQRICAALDNPETSAKIADRCIIAANIFCTGEKAARDGLDGRERVGEFVAENANQSFPGNLLFFLQRLADIGQQQERMRCAVLAKERLAEKPAGRLGAEGVNALISGGQEIIEPKLSRAVTKASRQRASKQLRSSVVYQLEKVLAIESEERRMHHLKNARQQGGGLKRADALLLQKVGERIDLAGKLAQRVGRAGSPRAKRIVSFAKRRDDVGERLKRPHEAFHERGRNEQEIDQEAKQKQQSWSC